MNSKESLQEISHTAIESVVASGIAVLALLHLKNSPTGEIFHRSLLFLKLVRDIDGHLDNLPDFRSRLHYSQQLLDFLTNGQISSHASLFLSESPHALPSLNILSEQPKTIRGEFLSDLQELLHVTEIIRHTRSRNQYLALTIQEADIMTRLLSNFLPVAPKDQSSATEFVTQIRRLARFRNLEDNARDLPTDFANHQTKLPPTPVNQRYLLRRAYKILLKKD